MVGSDRYNSAGAKVNIKDLRGNRVQLIVRVRVPNGTFDSKTLGEIISAAIQDWQRVEMALHIYAHEPKNLASYRSKLASLQSIHERFEVGELDESICTVFNYEEKIAIGIGFTIHSAHKPLLTLDAAQAMYDAMTAITPAPQTKQAHPPAQRPTDNQGFDEQERKQAQQSAPQATAPASDVKPWLRDLRLNPVTKQYEVRWGKTEGAYKTVVKLDSLNKDSIGQALRDTETMVIVPLDFVYRNQYGAKLENTNTHMYINKTFKSGAENYDYKTLCQALNLDGEPLPEQTKMPAGTFAILQPKKNGFVNFGGFARMSTDSTEAASTPHADSDDIPF